MKPMTPPICRLCEKPHWQRDLCQFTHIPASMAKPVAAISCHGKKRFDNFKMAEKTAKRSRSAKGKEGEHLQAYHCTACQGFHVGARSGRVADQRKVAKVARDSHARLEEG